MDEDAGHTLIYVDMLGFAALTERHPTLWSPTDPTSMATPAHPRVRFKRNMSGSTAFWSLVSMSSAFLVVCKQRSTPIAHTST